MTIHASVVIVNWNGRKWLKNCLSSIQSQELKSGNFEIILVDNGSADGSIEYVAHAFPQVKLVRLSKNYGFAEGNNRGVKHARGDFLVFVNTDVQALAGWLENLMNAAEHHPEYQILCSFVLPETEGNKVRTLNAFGDAVRFPCPSTGDIIDSLFAVGGCFLIRRSWLDKLGYLFDPYYFCYAEDSELSLRTVLLGGRIGYVRSSKLYHFGGGSELSSERIIYLGTRNMLLTYYKLLRVQTFILLCSLNLTYKAIQFMRKRQTSNLISLVKGTLAFFFSHSRYTQYRRDFNEIKLRTDRYLLERLFYRSEREEKFFKRLYRVSSGFNPLIAQSKP